MTNKRGRPCKTGLDWFPFEVGLLTDRKLRAPRAHHGPAAALTYLALLTLIYQDKGYYLDYRESVREDVALDVSDLISGRDRVKPEEIMAIIEELAERALFDKGCFAAGVLTSRRIQRTYYNAVSERKSANINWDIWLLSEADMRDISQTGPILKCYLQAHEKLETENNRPKNSQSKLKDSTVKDSTVQQNRGEDTFSSTSVEVSGADAPGEDLPLYRDYWNRHVAEPNGLPKVRECAKWSAARKQNLQARIRGEGAQGVLDVFDKAARSDYLCGKVDNWHMDFDWVIADKNFQKIAEGRFDNFKSKAKAASSVDFYKKLARGER
ncbi:DUF4373 domain-containing protein [Pseudoramibacter porci]|uniref:DUF4373 domain-containing protein n=1 Tax=Pseudoramibacter porci TaxID=2606631 RepID=A0A7X2NGY3_9FIRM|nr:DUF4373 domain-containing protein [Pseudoramibacter porci]MSS20210.1 DUF4373 domain-containing protein [Pseudoramibacter porci]